MSELCYLGARKLAALLRQRSVSAVEVTAAHLDQVARLNPSLNAIVTITAAQALERAMKLDQAAGRGEFQGSLHGLPVAHKDLFDTRGVRTTYGSLIYELKTMCSMCLCVSKKRPTMRSKSHLNN